MAIRINNIDIKPFFIDESVNLNLAERMTQGGFFLDVWEGRPLLHWSWLPFQAYRAAPVFTARVTLLLCWLPAMAALLSLARQLAGWQASIVFFTLLLFNPYHDFFQRLALADNLATVPVTLAFVLAWRWRKRTHLVESIAIGSLLFLTFLAKVSHFLFFTIPLFAAWSARKRPRFMDVLQRRALLPLGVALGLAIGFTLVATWRGHDILTTFHIHGTGEQLLDIHRFLKNVANTLVVLTNYMSLPYLALLLLSIAMMSIHPHQSHLYLISQITLPMVGIWLAASQQSRFWLFPMTIALLGFSVWLTKTLLLSKRHWLRLASLSIFSLWLVTWSLPFLQTSRHAPEKLLLDTVDTHQYIQGDSAGLAFRTLHSVLLELEPDLVLGIISNCQSLRYFTIADYPVLCPRVNSRGDDIAAHRILLDSHRAAGVYAVLDSMTRTPAESPGVLLQIVDSPGGEVQYSIYDLAPQD